jgi:hypothetical protein
VAGGGIQIPVVHPPQLGHRARVVEQREHGEMRQVEPILVHDLGLLAALGEVVQTWLLLRELFRHDGASDLVN